MPAEVSSPPWRHELLASDAGGRAQARETAADLRALNAVDMRVLEQALRAALGWGRSSMGGPVMGPLQQARQGRISSPVRCGLTKGPWPAARGSAPTAQEDEPNRRL